MKKSNLHKTSVKGTIYNKKLFSNNIDFNHHKRFKTLRLKGVERFSLKQEEVYQNRSFKDVIILLNDFRP
jgi:hypothetical protein